MRVLSLFALPLAASAASEAQLLRVELHSNGRAAEAPAGGEGSSDSTLQRISDQSDKIQRLEEALNAGNKMSASLENSIGKLKEDFAKVLLAEVTANQAADAAKRSASNEKAIKEHLEKLDKLEAKGEDQDSAIAKNAMTLKEREDKLAAHQKEHGEAIASFETRINAMKEDVFTTLKEAEKDMSTITAKMYKYATREEMSSVQSQINEVQESTGRGTAFEQDLAHKIDELQQQLNEQSIKMQKFEGNEGSLMGGLSALTGSLFQKSAPAGGEKAETPVAEGAATTAAPAETTVAPEAKKSAAPVCASLLGASLVLLRNV